MCQRGFFSIGIEQGKCVQNLETLWRHAQIFGANSIFTIGTRYKHQKTDTSKAYKNIPYHHYADLTPFLMNRPHDTAIVGIEVVDEAILIEKFSHPPRAIYLLGAEDIGISDRTLNICDCVIKLPGEFSMNVATAGSIVMYDRFLKSKGRFSDAT